MNDFTIDNTGMKSVKGDSLTNNIALSLMVKKGSFFMDANFGSRLHTLAKMVPSIEKTAIDYTREALQWLIDTGRVKEFTIDIERDQSFASRLNIAIGGTRSNGAPITYYAFCTVGGGVGS